ncbi:MAG: FAD-dependent oxidoreductase [Planctomycetota bacterium]|nr:FAD-dependent oxidoreductase [Planctomycetota bacterium]
MTSSEKISIRIDGTTLEVDSGTQLAAALMGQGIFALRASPAGEDRGVLCAIGSCHECRATVDGHRGVRTCLVTVQDGMKIDTERPLGRKLRAMARFSEEFEEEADVVVIGAGPAGLSAACHAAELGQDVLVIDESPRSGGRIWAHRPPVPEVVRGWIDRARRAGIRQLESTTVIDGEPGSLISASVIDGGRTRIRCARIIVATGARERFLPFAGWTLPGVVGAGALQSLIKGGLDVRGKKIVVAGTGPLLLAVARLATTEGAEVILAEQASITRRIPLLASLLSSPARAREAWRLWRSLRSIENRSSCWPVKAEGKQQVERVHLKTPSGVRIESVDLLAVGFGLVPESRVAQGLGCQLAADGSVEVDRYQQTSVEGVLCAGEPTGVAGSESALVSGQVAGIVAAGQTPPAELLRRLRSHRRWGMALESAHQLRSEVVQLGSADDLICRCEDVSLSTVEGIESLRQARMQCRIAMGPCQGRVCVPILSLRNGTEADSVRPPWSTCPSSSSDLSLTDGH